MVDLKKYQGREKDGKYKSYSIIIKLIKMVVEAWEKNPESKPKS